MVQLHTLRYCKSDDERSLQLRKRIHTLYQNDDFQIGDTVKLVETNQHGQDLPNTYTILTANQEDQKFTQDARNNPAHVLECIDNTIKGVVGGENGVSIENSHITAPYDMNMSDVKIKHSMLEFDTGVKPTFTNTTMRSVTMHPSYRKLQLVNNAIMMNADIQDVQTIDNAYFLNIGKLNFKNSSIKDIDIARTADQAKYSVSIDVFDSDFVGYEHDMFDEETNRLSNLLVTNNAVYEAPAHQQYQEARERHKLAQQKRVAELDNYSNYVIEHVSFSKDGSKVFHFNNDTFANIEHSLTVDAAGHTRLVNYDLKPGDAIELANMATNSKLFMTFSEDDFKPFSGQSNSYKEPYDILRPSDRTHDIRDNINYLCQAVFNGDAHTNTYEQPSRIENSFLVVPARIELLNSEITDSKVVLSNADSSIKPCISESIIDKSIIDNYESSQTIIHDSELDSVRLIKVGDVINSELSATDENLAPDNSSSKLVIRDYACVIDSTVNYTNYDTVPHHHDMEPQNDEFVLSTSCQLSDKDSIYNNSYTIAQQSAETPTNKQTPSEPTLDVDMM